MTCIGARPGCFEDSFSLKLGLPGSAGSVPTVLHDATDTGTDYIFGGGQGCQNDTQGPQNSKKMNPARLVGGFIFIEFYTAGASFWWGPRVPK